MVSLIGCDVVGLSGKLVQRSGWFLIGAIAAAALAVFGVRWIGPLQVLETGVSDRVRIATTSPSAAQDKRISIVAIDEATMARLAYRSPVDRGLLAQVIELLAAAGAKTVGLDILLDQPTEPEKDARLAAAIKAFPGRVVLAWADTQSGMTEQQSTWLQAFQQASGGVFGFVNLTTDPDGLVRRHSRHLPGAGMPSFAAALAGVEAPAQAGLAWAIDWRLPVADGSPPFQKTPALILPLMAANLPLLSGWFEGRTVLIGADLPQQDRHATPLSTVTGGAATEGVAIHAHLVAQLLDGRLVPEWPEVGRWGVVLALAIAAGLVGMARWHLLLKMAGLAVLAGVYLAAVVGIASAGGAVLPVVAALIALVLSAGGAMGLDALFAHNERRFIRNAFAHYLAPQLVDALVRDPSVLRLGGERRVMSYLFTDIEGFTGMSEVLEPEALGRLLNDYLDGVSVIVMAHRGVVDKYIGDAVVGLFGVPGHDPAHAAQAVQCAVAIDAFAERFRAGIEGGVLGVTRIGVHSGEATVGNFGGRARFDYTAIGDAMNTAARLEGANKAFGTRIAVSQACLTLAEPHLAEALPVQPIGDIVLKGKTEALGVVTVNTGAKADWLAAYHEAYGLLDSDPAAARRQLACLSGDPVVALHLARLDAGGRGVRIEMTEK